MTEFPRTRCESALQHSTPAVLKGEKQCNVQDMVACWIKLVAFQCWKCSTSTYFILKMVAWFSAKGQCQCLRHPSQESRAAGWAGAVTWQNWTNDGNHFQYYPATSHKSPHSNLTDNTDIHLAHPSTIYTTLISADFLTAKIVCITQHFWTIWNHHWLRNDHWPCLIKPRLQNMKILVWLHQSQEAVDSIKIICSGAAAASLSVLVSHIRQTNTLKWLDA